VKLARCLKAASSLMGAAGGDNPEWQTRVLAAHALGVPPAGLYGLSFSPVEEESFFSLVRRVAGGEPLQHVIGEWDFFGRTFAVTPDALIPRPETELLVELALGLPLPPSPKVLDAGTGSGVIGITLALELPGATVVGTDISPAAAGLAAGNALRLQAANYLPVNCSLGDPLRGEFHLIVANLPYIPSGDIAGLDPVVRDHEPRLALDGGEKGFSLILELVRMAPGLLSPGGYIVLETGYDQEEPVKAMFSGEQWVSVETRRDLAGRHRFVTARRRP